MTTRHVTDVLRHADGTPWAAAKISFALAPGSYTATDAYPPDTVRLVTDADGAYDATLWCDEDGISATSYLASYPGSQQFAFDLPAGDGTPITMAELRTYDAAPTAAGNLAALLEGYAFIDLADAPTAYAGHAGKVVAVTEDEDALEFITAGGAGAVASVNAQTGVVVLGAGDVGADPAGTAATHAALTTSAHGGLFTQAAADALYRPIGYVPTWASITSKPTTIAGYGITDLLAYTNVANVFTLAQGVRVAAAGVAAGLYVPWVSGDALPTLRVGSSNASNNQIGLYIESRTERAIYAETTSGTAAIVGVAATNTGVSGQGTTGVRATGSTAFGLLAQASSGIGVYAEATSTGTPLYGVRNGALTGSAGPILKLEMGSSGTPAAGFGGSIDLLLKSSTTAAQSAAQILTSWPDAAGATHATRTSAVSVSTVSIAGALTERLRIDAGVVAGSAVATTVGLMVWDVDGAALKRVSVGAADSGGSGYKVLRIAN